MAAWDNDPITPSLKSEMPWSNDPIVSNTNTESKPWANDPIVQQQKTFGDYAKTFAKGAVQPFEPIGNDILEQEKANAEETGKAISEPLLTNENEPNWIKPIDATVRTVGKIGNAIGGTFGALFQAPAAGAIQASTEPLVKPAAEAISKVTGGNPENVTPEAAHQVAGTFGQDIGNALFAASGSELKKPEATPKEEPPPASNPNVGMSQDEALANLSMKAKQPWTNTEEMINAQKAKQGPITTEKELNQELSQSEPFSFAPGMKDKIEKLRGTQDQVNAANQNIDQASSFNYLGGMKEHVENLEENKQDILNPNRVKKGELTPEQVQANIHEPVAQAVSAGVPVERIEAELRASLPDSLNNKEELIQKAIPQATRNIAEDSVSMANDAKGVTPQNVQELNLGSVQDVTSPNAVRDTMDKFQGIGQQAVEKVLGKPGSFRQKFISAYNGTANEYTIWDSLNRAWSKLNGVDLGRRDLLELSDTALMKNISQGGGYRYQTFLGSADGSSQSVWRMQRGTSELKEDTNVLPYNTIKQNAIKGGIDAETLNKINLARNALDDYANMDRVAQESVKQIAENEKQVAQLRQQMASPDNQGFFASRKLKSQIEALQNENQAHNQFIKELGKKQTYMSKEDALATMAQYENNQVAKTYITGLNNLHGALLDDLVEAGKITPELAQKLKDTHPNYVPAFRTADDYTVNLPQRGYAGGAQKPFMRREIGERGADQVDVEGNIIRNIVNNIKKRDASQLRGVMLDNLRKILNDDAWSVVFRESKQDVENAINKLQSSNLQGITADMITKPNPDRIEKYNHIVFDINGKQLQLSVKDENMFKLLSNEYLQFAPQSKLLQSQLWLSRFKREAIITLDPTFPFRNAERGTMDFLVNSRRVTPFVDYIPGLSQFKTVGGTFFDKKFYDYYSINYGFGNVLSKSYELKSTDRIVDMIKNGQKPGGIIHKTFGGLQDLNNRVDAGTRILQFKVLREKLLAEGKDPKQAYEAAMIASKDVHLNFAQKGASNALNTVMQLIPLSRTYVNAMDKSLRMGQYAPVTWATGSAHIFLIYKTLQLYNSQYKDKDGVPFQEKLDPNITKDVVPIYYGNSQNQYFPMHLGWVWGRSMPAWNKTFDFTLQHVGSAVSAMGATHAENLIKQTPELQGRITGKQLFDAWSDWAFGFLTPESSLPPAVGLVTGLARNKDNLNRPIVPQTLEDKDQPGFTKYFNSTDAALVDFTHTLYAKYGIDISPAKAEFVTRQLGGTFSDTILKAGAHLYSAMAGHNLPAPEQGDIPGFKLFSGNTTEVPHEGIEAKYSNIWGNLKNITANEQALKAQAATHPEIAPAYSKFLEEHATELYWANRFAEANKALSAIRKSYENIIYADKDHLKGIQDNDPSIFGDKSKREALTKLKEEQIAIQKGVLQGIVDDLDKGNMPTNDIWYERNERGMITQGVDKLLPSENPSKQEKPVDNGGKQSYNSIFDWLNPVSDANAMEASMLPSDIHQLQYPPAIVQEAPADIQAQYKPGFLEEWLPNLKNKMDSMYRDNVIDYTIGQEGGDKFTQIPGDRGGATKYGITLAAYQAVYPKATVDTIKNLTEDQAKSFYQTEYWDKGQVDKLPIGVQDLVFDMNVNHGLHGSAIILQRALNDLGADIDVDGRIGTDTLNAANDFTAKDLRAALINERTKWVENIAKEDPSQKKFLEGWKNRIDAMNEIPNSIKEASQEA